MVTYFIRNQRVSAVQMDLFQFTFFACCSMAAFSQTCPPRTGYQQKAFTDVSRAAATDVAGVQYEDARIEFDQWPTVKPTLQLPFGQLPLLTFEGITLCQSITIGRFLARKFNLAGKTELEQARADMIVACLEDVNEIAIDFHFHEPDKTRQAEKQKTFLEEKLPKFLQQLENLLKENKGGDGYFVGDSLTWADINFVVLATFLGVVGAEGQLARYPKLSGLHDRVKKLPKIAEWIAKRPTTAW